MDGNDADSDVTATSTVTGTTTATSTPTTARTQKNWWAVTVVGTRRVTRAVARAAPAHTVQARLWWDSQAGGLAAAGTSLDSPYCNGGAISLIIKKVVIVKS